MVIDGNELRIWRETNDISISVLSLYCNVPEGFIKSFETYNNPRPESHANLIYLQYSMKYLLSHPAEVRRLTRQTHQKKMNRRKHWRYVKRTLGER